MDFYSPAFSVNSDMTDEELDKYFETYGPLSNLPTPPPAKERAIPAAQLSSTTTTTPPAPELQGTIIPVVVFYPSLCHTSHIWLVSPSATLEGAHGPLHEAPRAALSHVITPYPFPSPQFIVLFLAIHVDFHKKVIAGYFPCQHVTDILFIAYAAHLANLVTVTTHRPHVDVIRGFLERSNLPDEVVAFAACVLEQLSERFVGHWRDALLPAEFERGLKTFLETDDTPHYNAHINPDVIVLAALALAHGFLVDRLRSSRHWSIKESAGMFSVQEIEATKRAMLKDMDYGLFKIRDEHVMCTLGEMQKLKMSSVHKHERRRTLSINLAGTAIWSHGVQTPEPSP
jgi:hypothetical protein